MRDDPVSPVGGQESFFSRMLNDARKMAAENYYNRLPSMKQAVLADMAMGIQRSADAEEGIREQRMARAPRVFPAAMLNEQLGQPAEAYLGDERMELFVTPYELNAGVDERPRFIVGELNQDTISRRSPTGWSAPTAQNYQDEALSRLKPGQAIIITSGLGGLENYYTPEFSTAPRYVVAAKGEDGILYQREITPETYTAFKEAMRSGYPVGAEQLIIDEISSRSQMPRVRQDEVFSTYPTRLVKQLNYYDDSTVGEDVGGYVINQLPRGITAQVKYLPKEDNYFRALMKALEETGTKAIVENSPVDEGKYVLQHEYAHVFDQTQPDSPSESDEFRRTAFADADYNIKYIDNFYPDVNVSKRFGQITPGSTAATTYGVGDEQEEFAEKQALWASSKRYGRLGVDNEGNPVTFEDLFPNTARYFENLVRRER